MAYNRENDLDFDIENQQPSHHSYKQYKKKVSKRKNESLVMFISAFFVMLFVFLGLAKQLSPEIDVSIGSEESQSVEDTTKNNVDERLKALQMEDLGVQQGDDVMFDTSLDEKVVIPNDSKKAEDVKSEEVVESPSEVQQPPKEQKTNASEVAKAQTAKVVVGYYSTQEQAEVAKGILQEAGLNVNPFIRNIGGAYTIQTGSYSSREAAQSASAELLRNNFPARVIVE